MNMQIINIPLISRQDRDYFVVIEPKSDIFRVNSDAKCKLVFETNLDYFQFPFEVELINDYLIKFWVHDDFGYTFYRNDHLVDSRGEDHPFGLLSGNL
jgi:hypothetical protein